MEAVGEGRLDLAPDGRCHPMVDPAARVGGADHPLQARRRIRQGLQLEKMLDHALELGFHRPSLLAAQVVRLLGEIQQVERTVPALVGEGA
jgi:hypothetical protein